MLKLNKIATNISWLTLEKAIRIITFFFVGSYVIRYLGPEKFGILSLILTILSIFSVFSSWGIRGILVKKLAESQSNTSIILFNSFFITISFSLLFLIIFIIFTYFYSTSIEEDIFLLFFISSFALLFTFNEVISAYFESKINIKPITKIVVFANLLISAIKIIFLINESPLIYFVILIPVESLVIALFSVYVITKKINIFRFIKIDFKILKNFVYLGLPLAFASLVNILNMRIDQFMIINLLDFSQLGIYSAGVRISELFFIIPTALTASYFPKYVRAHSSKEYDLLKEMTSVLFIYSILSFIFVYFFGSLFINILFGNEYLKSAEILKILIFSTFFISFSLVNGKWLLKYEKTKIILYRVMISSLVNIILNYFLINLYGLNGAAYATIISYFVLFMLILIDKDGFKVLKTQIESIKIKFLIKTLKIM